MNQKINMAPTKKEVKELVKSNATIPWQDKNQWKEVFESIEKIVQIHGQKFDQICLMAKKIQGIYGQLSGPIGEVCSQTCTSCEEICCTRATLWFDFKDLLYIYFAGVSFPQNQIFKKEKDGLKACSYFTKTGCSVSRDMRPFICTWYFCPAQVQYLSCKDTQVKTNIDAQLGQIKVLRNKIEEEFIRISI